MADEEHFDIFKLDTYFERKLDAIKKDSKLSKHNRDIILNYLRDSELGKTINKGQKRKIGSGRNLQAAGFLCKMSKEWFKKDLDKVTIKDMENFILNLDKGKIISRYKKPYSSEAKSNIKKFIRKFYKWLLGDNKRYPELVDWIDTSKKEAEVKAVPGLLDGVMKIVELIPDIKRKALVMVAFDSGFRESELLSCKVKDAEKTEKGVYFITCRYSKTKTRTVSLPNSSELLDRWLDQHPNKDNREAELWETSRVMFYKTVKLYGKKALNMNITPHMLRHTSATFYAPKLDRVTFCKRYGWSYNSPSPDRYIDFAKVTENKVVDIVQSEQYGEMKKKFNEQKLKLDLMTERLDFVQNEFQKVENLLVNSDDFMLKLLENPKIKKLLVSVIIEKGLKEEAKKLIS